MTYPSNNMTWPGESISRADHRFKSQGMRHTQSHRVMASFLLALVLPEKDNLATPGTGSKPCFSRGLHTPELQPIVGNLCCCTLRRATSKKIIVTRPVAVAQALYYKPQP